MLSIVLDKLCQVQQQNIFYYIIRDNLTCMLIVSKLVPKCCAYHAKSSSFILNMLRKREEL